MEFYNRFKLDNNLRRMEDYLDLLFEHDDDALMRQIALDARIKIDRLRARLSDLTNANAFEYSNGNDSWSDSL